jgi:hypothetical protein
MDQTPYQPTQSWPSKETQVSAPEVGRIGRALGAFAQMHRLEGTAGRVIELSVSDNLTRQLAMALAEQVPAQERGAYVETILDAVLFVIEQMLVVPPLETDELAHLVRLQRLLGIGEKDLLTYSSSRVAAILQGEVTRLLADGNVEPTEALYQVGLQEVLGLTYDEYRQLTQPAADRVVDEIISDIIADGTITSEERLRLERQLIALDTFYLLTPERRASLSSAGLNINAG